MDAEDSMLPARLGGDWNHFVAEWCGGHPPGYEVQAAVSALRTIEELWPDGIDQFLNFEKRGLYPAAALIEFGRLLSLVRGCEGFETLLPRVRQLTQGAHAELIVAASLVQVGLSVRLGVENEGSVLDLAIDGAMEGPIFVEVTAPLESDEAADRRRIVWELTDRLRSANVDATVEIEFLIEPSRNLLDKLVEHVPQEYSGAWISIDGQVTFRRHVVVSGACDFSIKWPHIDRRTERIVRDKYRQLSSTHPNILVVDMGAMGGSIAEWECELEKIMQPNKNRRVGAVALYRSLFSAHRFCSSRFWRVIPNRYATRAVPNEVLTAIQRLNDSSYQVAPEEKSQ